MRNHLSHIVTKFFKKSTAFFASLAMVIIVLLQPTFASAVTTTSTSLQVDHAVTRENYSFDKSKLKRVGLFDKGDFWAPKPINPVGYYPACSVSYERCVAKNGSRFFDGSSRCLYCMNICNQTGGWFPTNVAGCGL
jgi:hypothetical protein